MTSGYNHLHASCPATAQASDSYKLLQSRSIFPVHFTASKSVIGAMTSYYWN